MLQVLSCIVPARLAKPGATYLSHVLPHGIPLLHGLIIAAAEEAITAPTYSCCQIPMHLEFWVGHQHPLGSQVNAQAIGCPKATTGCVREMQPGASLFGQSVRILMLARSCAAYSHTRPASACTSVHFISSPGSTWWPGRPLLIAHCCHQNGKCLCPARPGGSAAAWRWGGHF